MRAGWLPLTALVMLVLAAPAQAQRGWEPPRLAASYPTQTGDAAVSGDGTVIAMSQRDSQVSEITAGTTTRYVRGAAHPHVAAGGAHELVAAWDQDGLVYVSGHTGAAFTEPQVVGPGQLAGLASNADGDMALVINAPDGVRTAFRPARGTFGTPVTVPGLPRAPSIDATLISIGPENPFAVAVGADGETVIVRAREDVRVATRTREGQVTDAVALAPERPPGTLPPSAPAYMRPRVGIDEQGRVLALWGRRQTTIFDYALAGAIRRDDSWQPVGGLSAPGVLYDAAVDRAGNAVVTWSRGSEGVFATRGTLGTGAFAAPEPLDMVGSPTVAIAPDGSAIIAADQFANLRAVRRTGVGGWSGPELVGCGNTPVAAGFDAGGDAALAYRHAVGGALTLVREREGAQTPAHACAIAPPFTFFGTRGLAHPGEPQVLPVPGATAVDWDFDGEPGYEEHSDGGGITHTFPTLADGSFFARVTTPQGQFATSAFVPLYPKVAMTAAGTHSSTLVRSGLQVTLSTATPDAVGRRVWVVLRDRRATLTQRSFPLSATPTTVTVPFGKRARKALAARRAPFGLQVIAATEPYQKYASPTTLAETWIDVTTPTARNAPWHLTGVSGNGRKLLLEYAGGGCLRRDGTAEVAESRRRVRIRVRQTVDDPSGPGAACTKDLRVHRLTVKLRAPIAGRRVTGGPRFDQRRFTKRVPRLIGLDARDALTVLDELRVRTALRGPRNGTVTAQTPRSGSRLQRTATVTAR